MRANLRLRQPLSSPGEVLEEVVVPLVVADGNHVRHVGRDGLDGAHEAVPLLALVLEEVVAEVAAVQHGVVGALGDVRGELREAGGILKAKVGVKGHDGAAGPLRGGDEGEGSGEDVGVGLGDACGGGRKGV